MVATLGLPFELLSPEVHNRILVCCSNISLVIFFQNKKKESIFGHGERGGESEMYGESNMETYVTIFKTDSQREVAECLRKLKQGLCINLGVRREMGK